MANTTKTRNMRTEHTASFYLQEAYYLARELERMPSDAPERSRTADETLCAAETAVLAARRAFGGMMEKGRQGKPLRLVPRSAEVTGAVKVTREGWTVIRLDTMLQNARRRTTGYIENSILELLKQWRGSGGVLPWYRHAFVVITEHTDRKSGNVYDPDNREWKTVTNALKGVLFEDDDQFTVSLILDTVPDGRGYTEIAVLPYHEAATYLAGRRSGKTSTENRLKP